MHKTGRLIDHLDVRVSDPAASLPFYRAVLGALGLPVEELGDAISTDELYVTASGTTGRVTRDLHLCFQAGDRQAVQAFHAAGLANNGRDNGAPGLRDYHPGYYAAFLLDPDGNNIEAKLDERTPDGNAPQS
ncbi:VOC family protein [Pseudooceanicola sp. MF1-13]|uniref:VOC family protein n=1 Tax=Pseudooceanicola sp. MF1-13 TaxID=3379095 RepID=UPI0038915FE5